MSAYQHLEQHFEKLAHLEHLQAIANWDEACMMPEGGGAARAAAMATLSRLTHEMLTDKKVGELIKKAQDETLKDRWQQANLSWMQREYERAVCLPADLVEKLSKANMEAEQVWRSQRANNDWAAFKPYLDKSIALTKESANILSQKFSKSPYDLLIDRFSPGINQAFIDPIFAELKTILPRLIERITAKQKQHQPLELDGPFRIEKQRELGLALMQAIGFDFNHGRLDVSHHPFCGGVPEDVRLTTRYIEKEFKSAIMGICHETGHARYEQNLPRQWLNQPVGRVNCMTKHESQSLLIEMQACRSREFMDFLTPLVRQHFGEQDGFTAENLFRTYTSVNPGFIRVDADEVTYPLHVILRYEIEKNLIDGDTKTEDLPAVWDAKMKLYLGLSTGKDYKDGVMQDVHWPAGLFGYFPAYTLGSLTAAQLFAAAQKAQPELKQRLSRGDFSHLYDWLIPHFQARASSVDFNTLMVEATGEVLNPDYFIKHVEQRYLNT